MLNKLRNWATDFALGIRTTGIVETHITDGCHTSTVDYAIVERVLNRLRLGPEDVFVDIGCGKGRVVCVAARRKLCFVSGIELSSDMAVIAAKNVERLRGRYSSAMINQNDATRYDYGQTTVAYLFHPFEANVLEQVLAKIRVDRKGRRFRCAFVNLSPAQEATFLRHQDWLTCTLRWIEKGKLVAIYATDRSGSDHC
ncbi:SAM-dependent methyltransferase [Bradyrhizobium ottawaense]|uniref:methyltransferase domain-containing protein n=1 Tax=Bradyrhizobium ottawaense TaxID=931866 RepID=UPI003832B0FA